MATGDLIVTITIPAAIAGQPATAICANYGYQATLTEPDGTIINNPVTAQEFAFLQIMNFIKNNMKQYQIPPLALSDRQAASDSIDAIQFGVVITVSS